MRIGIIGSGRVGYSIGKYLVENRVDVTGYYDKHPGRAAGAASFTNTASYEYIDELVRLNDTLFITTEDSEIEHVWDYISEFDLKDKIICHFSGSLSSDVFTNIESTGAIGVSVHPMLAFSDRYNSYKQLNKAYFTLEGSVAGVSVLYDMFRGIGNHVRIINASDKLLYHCALSMLSNHVLAVIHESYEMLLECGFNAGEVIDSTAGLVTGNIANIISQGSIGALTGPIERNDIETVRSHLSVLQGEQLDMYRILGSRLVEIAGKKNPGRDYDEMSSLLTIR